MLKYSYGAYTRSRITDNSFDYYELSQNVVYQTLTIVCILYTLQKSSIMQGKINLSHTAFNVGGRTYFSSVLKLYESKELFSKVLRAVLKI